MATLTALPIDLPLDQIEAFCKKHQIRKLALFGSILREDFKPDSDIDVLVEFEPEAKIGYEFIDIQDQLTELFGREVDLNTAGFLSRHFRQKVLDSALVVYERAG